MKEACDGVCTGSVWLVTGTVDLARRPDQVNDGYARVGLWSPDRCLITCECKSRDLRALRLAYGA